MIYGNLFSVHIANYLNVQQRFSLKKKKKNTIFIIYLIKRESLLQENSIQLFFFICA